MRAAVTRRWSISPLTILILTLTLTLILTLTLTLILTLTLTLILTLTLSPEPEPEPEPEPHPHPYQVNLIPYNPTSAGDVRGFEPPTEQRVASFHARLRARGLSALVRWTSASGRDVDGACGQLALKTIEPSPPLPPPPPPSPSPLASSRSI